MTPFCSSIPCLLLRAVAIAFAAIGAARAGDEPQVRPVGTVAPDVILVPIRAQRVEHGRQVPYEKQAGDTVAAGLYRFVRRNGKLIGALAGPQADILFTCDELRGEPLDVAWAGEPSSYRVVSSDDPRFASGIAPNAIHRKSRPFDFCRTSDHHGAPQDHFLYLRLPAPLQPGKHYSVRFLSGKLSACQADFAYDAATLRSDAIHVSQIGFRPDDPAKVAFLSCWWAMVAGSVTRMVSRFH